MIEALLLGLLLAACPGLNAQSVDPKLDEYGSLSQPAEAPSIPLSVTRNITVPVQTQIGINVPSRIVIPTAAGGLSIEMKTPEQIKAETPPPAPRSPYAGLIALAVAVLTAGYMIRTALLERKETVVKVVEPPPLEGAAWSSNFAIIRAIGEGGMGVVYEAMDRTLDRKVAIKKMRDEIRQNPGDAERFLKEAKTVAALLHPNIVQIHTVMAQGGDIYLVFEFVEGRTVDSILRERRRLTLPEAKGILGAICQALDYAHGHGVIHRDLKPANVMINQEGIVKVMDFGIARKVREQTGGGAVPGETRPDMTNTIIGTPYYMAPEAKFGVLCLESDIYALGVITYQMLTGALPFPNPSAMDMNDRQEYPKPSAARVREGYHRPAINRA